MRKEVKLPSGAVMVLGVAPKAGTKLTRERMLKNLQSLNEPWRKRRGASRVSEIERIKGVKFYPSYDVECIRCGKEIILWWNGGELDYKICCGLEYALEHAQIDFVIREERSEG